MIMQFGSNQSHGLACKVLFIQIFNYDEYKQKVIDQMTQVGFWTDDSQIVDLRIKKYYAEKASIFIEYEEVFNE